MLGGFWWGSGRRKMDKLCVVQKSKARRIIQQNSAKEAQANLFRMYAKTGGRCGKKSSSNYTFMLIK